MRTGLLQFFIVVSLSLLGLKAAGQQSSQLNNQAEDIGCIFMTAHKDFDGLKRQLERRGSTVEQFFLYAQCENETTYEKIEMPTVSPFQMTLQKPTARTQLAFELIAYLANYSPLPDSVLLAILNYRDQKGRTMLDFLNFQYDGHFAGDGDAIRDLGMVKDLICKRGGVAEPEVMQLCEHESLPGATSGMKPEPLSLADWLKS